MQRPAQHSTPTTTDALSVSPASSGRTADTAVPPLSTSGNVTSPALTTIQQQAAFLNSAHGPATCNAGGVSATPSLIATQTPEPESRNAALTCNQPRLLLSPPYLRLAYPLEIPSLSTSAFRRASFLPSPKFCLPSLQLTTYRRKCTSRHRRSTKTIRDSLKAAWNTVSANRKPATTTHPRSKLITVGIQLPPGTLKPKLPLYDLLSTIIAAANLSPKTSAELTLQVKPAQSLVFLKTHSSLTAHFLLSLTSLELNGHRAHQCPQHSVPAKCRRCASPLPADPDAHVCAQPWCIHCQVNAHSSLDSTWPYLLAKQRDCAKAAFLCRTAMRRATQPSPPSSSAHDFLPPPATSLPGSYTAKVKRTPTMCTYSSNTPSPSLNIESRSFDLRLAASNDASQMSYNSKYSH
ncbi:hypothetical protein HPB51_008369 [Rhipicephalus microplus]|uniref:Uncharacterized protein n=1 Tax=Rhipicephalus microplus TaxID=6941 RepID=A0A9J6DU29_RHIMP|nr:hypothetical protein HPB51_008369 [Rhipicephalus microplus]